MDIKELDVLDIMVCRKVAMMMEKVMQTHQISEISFAKYWFKTQQCKWLAISEPTEICQSEIYFYNSIKKGLDEIPEHKEYSTHPETMYWFGYTTQYWIYARSIDPTQIEKTYDIEKILQNYDVLHTYSTKRAIEEIEKMTIGRTIADKILT